MASETDKKTRKGLNTGLNKLEDVAGTLNAIDPDHSAFDEPLRRAKALVAGSLAQCYHLQHLIVALSEGEELPAQMSLDELTSKTARRFPSAREEDLEHVASSAQGGEEAAARANDPGPPATTDLLLRVRPDRPWNDFITGSWSPAERTQVAGWAKAVADGDDLPEPELVARRYLEDLDLEQGSSRVALLSWVGFTLPPEAEWSEELWEETLTWAEAAHRWDRGQKVDIPTLPSHLNPAPELFRAVKNLVFQSTDTISRHVVVKHFKADQVGAGLAVDALVELGDLVVEHEVLSAESPHIDWSAESLALASGNVARRRPARGAAESADNAVKFLGGDKEEADGEEGPDDEPTEEGDDLDEPTFDEPEPENL